MKKILLLIFTGIASVAIAQPPADTTNKAVDFDSLLNMVEDSQPKEKPLVTATFKSSRIINGHSVELAKPKHLEFRLSHRFSSVRDGLDGFFGLDNASTRIGLEYGINEFMMVGLGRSGAYSKSVDAFYKAKVLRQREGGMPITLTLFGSAVISTIKNNIPNYRFDSRLTYTVQAIIASKISEKLSLQLSPTLVHRNLVPTAVYPNDLIAIGVGGRLKLSRRISLNAEYFYRVLSSDYRKVDPYHNALAIGFDFDTGGHIFSLHFTNSRPQIEPGFIGETSYNWLKGDFSFGFNITRQFYLGKKTKAPQGW